MKLSPRLLKIAALVPRNAVVADVGTDHALLPAYLVVTGRSPRVIATDAKPGPLEAARATVREFAAEGRIDFRLGFGLTVLEPHEADAVVLAGLGGHTVVAILERSPEVRATVRRFILQPATAAGPVRRWLLAHGFRLAAEDLAREGGRFHEIIAAEPAAPAPPHPTAAPASAAAPPAAAPDPALAAEPLLSDLGLEVGPRLWESRHPLLRAFLEDRLARCRGILEQMGRSGLEGDRALERYRRRARTLEALLARL